VVLRTPWALVLSATLLCLVANGSAGARGASSRVSHSTSPHGGTSSAWTVYHHTEKGVGALFSVAGVDTTAPKWTSPTLDGQLYGEPLVLSGRIYVATENDTVYALSSSTGAVVWSTHLGTPVNASSLPCGDISPVVGITGTPVIDAARHEIFVVADEVVHNVAAHMFVGLSLSTGKVKVTQDVDPPGAVTADILQRTGLTLDHGQVVFGYGGNDGDCASYHGWVMAEDETGGTPKHFEVDAPAGDSQGAIWMGGAAPSVDGSGNVWVSAGNGSVTSSGDPYDDSDSVLELSSSLDLLQYFAPSTWAYDNGHDLDMTTEPALLSDGLVVEARKQGQVFLLNGKKLGGIGGQLAMISDACGGDIDGGDAVVGLTVYLPCRSGASAVKVTTSPPALTLLWSSGLGGGPPIFAAGEVWTIGQNGTLYGLNPKTGGDEQEATIGAPANHFPTPSIGDGLLLAPSSNDVVAFTTTPKGHSTSG
jgi:polyvinyl alcohol dehydrogenase (cytochrome)